MKRRGLAATTLWTDLEKQRLRAVLDIVLTAVDENNQKNLQSDENRV